MEAATKMIDVSDLPKPTQRLVESLVESIRRQACAKAEAAKNGTPHFRETLGDVIGDVRGVYEESDE